MKRKITTNRLLYEIFSKYGKYEKHTEEKSQTILELNPCLKNFFVPGGDKRNPNANFYLMYLTDVVEKLEIKTNNDIEDAINLVQSTISFLDELSKTINITYNKKNQTLQTNSNILHIEHINYFENPISYSNFLCQNHIDNPGKERRLDITKGSSETTYSAAHMNFFKHNADTNITRSAIIKICQNGANLTLEIIDISNNNSRGYITPSRTKPSQFILEDSTEFTTISCKLNLPTP